MNEKDALLKLIYESNNKIYDPNDPLLSEIIVSNPITYHDDNLHSVYGTNTEVIITAKENSSLVVGEKTFYYNRLNLNDIFYSYYINDIWIEIEIPSGISDDDIDGYVKTEFLNYINSLLEVKISESPESVEIQDISDLYTLEEVMESYPDKVKDGFYFFDVYTSSYNYVYNEIMHFNVTIIDNR